MKNTKAKSKLISIIARQGLAAAFALILLSSLINAQTTLFSFQGKLPNEVVPATGIYEMEFKLFDAETGGTQIGVTNAVGAVDVKSRSFTVWLDFGAAAFPGADRFIEISYRRNQNQPFTTLVPRERILSAPYSIRSLTATTADNALNLGGVSAGNFVQTTDPRLSDDRNPLPGSNNYIQNTTVQQSPANFNISGSGAANTFNAATQYNLRSNRILSADNNNNTFVGLFAGGPNTTGIQNTFVGLLAGNSNTTGRNNSFFGVSAGSTNTTGQENSFFGSSAGRNSVGSNNTFFGASAGSQTTTGSENTFIGRGAGLNHTVGRGNTFVGDLSGFSAPSTVINVNNTLLGSNTKVAPGVFNSTAVGTGATVSTTNTIVLGTDAQTTYIPGGAVNTFNSNNFRGLIADNLIFRNLANFIPTSSSPVCFRFTTYTNVAGNLDGGYGLTNCNSSFSSSASKTDIQPFTEGLEIIKRLKPVSFKWKGDGVSDLGLNAEDVAEVAPQFVRRNRQGAVEDVKENSLNIILINAVKEQQTLIEAQQRQIDALKKLVCQTNAQAEICK